MNKLYIIECDDINKLREECIKQHNILFLIGECLVRESKKEITDTDAVKRIRKIMTDFQCEPEVRHGRWIKQENGLNLCSVCGVTKVSHLPFCGHCGAKMDRGAENDT